MNSVGKEKSRMEQDARSIALSPQKKKRVLNKGKGWEGRERRAFPIPMAAGSPESSLLRGDRRIFKPASQEACSIKQDASAAFSETNLLAAGQGPATRACFLKQPNGNFLIKIYIFIFFFKALSWKG